MKNRMARPLTATITALKRALSRTPLTSNTMMNSTMMTAGRLMMAPGVCAEGAALIHIGSSIPAPARSRCMYPLQPIATVIDPTAYSRMRSQPISQAKTSPSDA